MVAATIKEIQSQHFEHKVWMNELSFYADEVKIYERQLEELVGKNIKEMLPMLEQFQNNFIRQKEVIDELKHEINAHEHELAVMAEKDLNLAPGSRYDHLAFREQMDTFKKIYSELKAEFIRFWGKWH